MKKNNYEQPRVEVAELEQTDFICASPFTSTPNPNESYVEVEEVVTNDWYN